MDTTAIFVSAAVALIVALSTHRFTSSRDRNNKRREQRATYLINAFRVFSKMCNHPAIHELADEIEEAVADIQLFGTKEQVEEVHKIVNSLAIENTTANLDRILYLLRDDLRQELGSETINGKIMWIKLYSNEQYRSHYENSKAHENKPSAELQ